MGPGLDARARLVMSFEILCSEPWARFDPVRVLQSSTGSYLAERGRVARAAVRPSLSVCAAGRRAGRLSPSVPTDVPVLILAGSADPQDPPANMRGWRTFFPKGRMVVVPGATHGVLRRAAWRSSQRSSSTAEPLEGSTPPACGGSSSRRSRLLDSVRPWNRVGRRCGGGATRSGGRVVARAARRGSPRRSSGSRPRTGARCARRR